MIDDDERPSAGPVSSAVALVVGQPLDALSLHDFDERIAILRAEIARLEAARAAKQAARDAAGSIFGPR